MKEKHFIGLGFQWVAGTKCQILLMTVLVFLSGSCQFLNDSFFSPSGESSQEAESLEEDENEEDENENEKSTPLPNAATAWDTQVLLLSHQLPSSEQIQNCRLSVENLSATANDESSMIKARDSLSTTISEKFPLYHWCFFILMHQVDTKLESVGSDLKSKADFFLTKMQQLWILARALDSFESDSTYFLYLRDRYIQISRSIFGRGLSVIGKSMDTLPRSQWTPDKSILQNSFGKTDPENDEPQSSKTD